MEELLAQSGHSFVGGKKRKRKRRGMEDGKRTETEPKKRLWKGRKKEEGMKGREKGKKVGRVGRREGRRESTF